VVNLATGRKVCHLAAAELEALPSRCRGCLFWELGSPRPIDRDAHGWEADRQAHERKAAWWRASEFGELEADAFVPGRVVRVEGETAGWCELGPPRAFARGDLRLPPPSSDALLLTTLRVEPAHRGHGIGKLLIQAAAKEAVRTERRALEAYGDRRHRDDACLIPVTFLLHTGFEVHREHQRYPLLRLDVGRLARIVEEVESAVEHALEVLAPRRVPDAVPQRAEP
jgi:GNAT superfamily N-acetyltransferase